MKERLQVGFQAASMVILVPIGVVLGALWALSHLARFAWSLFTGWD